MKGTVKPIVYTLAKENELQIQQISAKDNLFSSVSGASSDLVPVDCAKSIPLDVMDGFKQCKSKGKNKLAIDTIKKFAHDKNTFSQKNSINGNPVKIGKEHRNF